MSYSKKVYVGIYIECYNPLVPYFIDTKKCCNKDYSFNSIFCSICEKN